MADEEAWGQLLCVTEAKAPIRLGKKIMKIGRTNGRLVESSVSILVFKPLF